MFATKFHSEVHVAEPDTQRRVANPTISARLLKTTNHLFKTANHLKKTAQLLFMHTTSCSAKRNWSKWGSLFAKNKARLSRERAEHMIFLNEHSCQADVTEEDVLDLSWHLELVIHVVVCLIDHPHVKLHSLATVIPLRWNACSMPMHQVASFP